MAGIVIGGVDATIPIVAVALFGVYFALRYAMQNNLGGKAMQRILWGAPDEKVDERLAHAGTPTEFVFHHLDASGNEVGTYAGLDIWADPPILDKAGGWKTTIHMPDNKTTLNGTEENFMARFNPRWLTGDAIHIYFSKSGIGNYKDMQISKLKKRESALMMEKIANEKNLEIKSRDVQSQIARNYAEMGASRNRSMKGYSRWGVYNDENMESSNAEPPRD